jgi:hypothetical protein
MEQLTNDSIDLGAWIGRGQAFGVVANGCTAAQAECLRQISESGTYKQTGLTWDDFCHKYVGLSRPRVDTLIKNLEEFGKTFFELSNIVRISPEAYRQVATKIEGQSIQLGAELVPIVPENAARIRNAIKHLRGSVRKAEHEIRATKANLNLLYMQLESVFTRMRELATDPLLTKTDKASLEQILEHFQGQAEQVERALENYNRITR